MNNILLKLIISIYHITNSDVSCYLSQATIKYFNWQRFENPHE